MRLVELGPDDLSDLDDFVRVARESAVVDAPWLRPLTRHRLQMEMRHGWDGEVGRYFLARVEDEVVGTVDYFGSEYDNPDVVWVESQIAPAHRGQGLGRLLVAEVEGLARADRRPVVTIGAWNSPAARTLGAACGYRLGSVGVHRVLALDGSGEESLRFARFRDAAAEKADGYRILRIDGLTPDALLEGVVRATEAINDSPLDDLEYGDEVYDVSRVRAYEQAQLDSGYRFRRVVALAPVTGEVVGHTVVSVDAEQPSHGEQHDTAVVPEHRGHSLGLLLKSEMLCWLAEEEPGLRSVHTSNAGSNAHMIAVNERLGYAVAGERLLLQRRVGLDQ